MLSNVKVVAEAIQFIGTFSAALIERMYCIRCTREGNHKQLFITPLNLFKLRLIESRSTDVAHMCTMFTWYNVDQQQDTLIINIYVLPN